MMRSGIDIQLPALILPVYPVLLNVKLSHIAPHYSPVPSFLNLIPNRRAFNAILSRSDKSARICKTTCPPSLFWSVQRLNFIAFVLIMLMSILKGCNDTMRVLDTHTGQFVKIDPQSNPYQPVKYAIFSHTWDRKGEQTYQKLRKIQRRYAPSNDDSSSDEGHSSQPRSGVRVNSPPTSSNKPSLSLIWGDRKLSPKIREACRVARENGHRYLWIDSCCIDKTSSSELSESINSMFQWYTCADVCYAFLPDVPAEEDHCGEGSHFRGSRWFKRGWTLQELIAPLDVRFLSKEWMPIGSKESLADLVIEITHINYNALLNIEPLEEFSVAQRFSWAAKRETTREEDRAYSLLGIFNINMPTLYGEGMGAFRRLQEEILRRTPDQSLFAWTELGLPDPSSRLYKPDTTTPDGKNRAVYIKSRVSSPRCSFFARSPDEFKDCTDITALSHAEVARRLQLHPNQLSTTEYTFTPHGIRTRLPVISLPDFFPLGRIIKEDLDFSVSQWYLVVLGCGHKSFPGHLLARVCCIETSGSNLIESLQSGRIDIHRDLDLLPVSSATIARLRSLGRQISVKTLYIPQPERDWGHAWEVAGQALRQYKTMKLVLSEKSCEALSTQGYTATLRSPDDADRCTHSVILSHHTHDITVDYQHTFYEGNYHRQHLMIEAQVQTSGTGFQPDTLGDLGVPLKAGVAGSKVLWQSSMEQCMRGVELGFKEVVLNIAGSPMELMARLGLTHTTTNHYLIRIELKTADRPSSPSGHNDVIQAVQSDNPRNIDVASPSLPTEGISPGLAGPDAGQLARPVDVREPEGQNEEARRSWRRRTRTL